MSVAGINVLQDETRARAAGTRAPLLTVRGVKTYYGNIIALKGVDLDVNEGEIVTLIGANGAGKSTLMMTIFGSPGRARARSPMRAGTSRRCRPTRSPASTWRSRRKGGGSSRG